MIVHEVMCRHHHVGGVKRRRERNIPGLKPVAHRHQLLIGAEAEAVMSHEACRLTEEARIFLRDKLSWGAGGLSMICIEQMLLSRATYIL